MGERRPDEVKRRRHTPDQIVHELREADRMLAHGSEAPQMAKGARGLGGDLPPLATRAIAPRSRSHVARSSREDAIER
jgi:hypothetical protein